MLDYRAYIIGGDGHFLKAILLECADDDEATALAKQLVDGNNVELWKRSRMIAKFSTCFDR
jgi:hypothetical protein